MVESDQKIYVVVCLSALSVLIVVSNVSIFALVCFDKKLRTYTNWLTLSLAVSDILTGGVLLPVVLIKPTSVVGKYLTSMILLWGVANICAVTYDRYVAVMKPLQYPYLIPKLFKRVIVALWLVPAIYSLLPLFWGTDRTKTVNLVYMVFLEFLGVVVPYIFITVAYIRIFKEVRRSLALRKNLESATKQVNERRRISSDAQVAKVFSIVSLAFLFSWMPILYMTTTGSIFNGRDIVPVVLIDVSFFTVAAGSLLNPLVYAFLKPDFKLAVRNFCQKRFGSGVDKTNHSFPVLSVSREKQHQASAPAILTNTEGKSPVESET